MTRLATGDMRAVYALATDQATKDALATFDWEPDATPVTEAFDEAFVLQTLFRHLGREDDGELRLRRLPDPVARYER